jgi:hypothetical protein
MSVTIHHNRGAIQFIDHTTGPVYVGPDAYDRALTALGCDHDSHGTTDNALRRLADDLIRAVPASHVPTRRELGYAINAALDRARTDHH